MLGKYLQIILMFFIQMNRFHRMIIPEIVENTAKYVFEGMHMKKAEDEFFCFSCISIPDYTRYRVFRSCAKCGTCILISLRQKMHTYLTV